MNVTGIKVWHIVKKAELQLLGLRIWQCTYTIKKLNESLTTTQRHTFEETRSRQQSKFKRLYQKSQTKKEVTDTDIDTNRWVMNLSDKQISDDEWSILSKGLNFAITPRSKKSPRTNTNRRSIYREKITNMVGDTNTYTRLSKDATDKYKNRMINIPRKGKRNRSISDKLYWKL